MIVWVLKYDTCFDWITSLGGRIESPIYQVFIRPFGKPVIVLTDPREIEDILLHRTREFDRANHTSDIFVGTIPNHHIVQPTNDRFRTQRKLLAGTMRNEFLKNVAARHIYVNALRLVEFWRIKSVLAPGCSFEVADDLTESALDSIWAVTFGTDVNTIQSRIDHLQNAPPSLSLTKVGAVVFPKAKLPDEVQSVLHLCDGIGFAMNSIHPRLGHWLYRQTRSYKSAVACKDRMIMEALNDAQNRLEAAKPTGESPPMLSAIDYLVQQENLSACKDGRRPIFDSAVNRDELFGFLIGGHDTTSTTLMWSLKMLSDNPRVQTKLRKVIQEVFPDMVDTNFVPHHEQIAASRIPFLDATIQEILRLALTQPGAIREAKVDTAILGLPVPKGTNVFLMSNGNGYVAPDRFVDQILEESRSRTCVNSRGKRGCWGNDAECFIPERWIKLEEGIEIYDSKAGPIQAFGGGVRGQYNYSLGDFEVC
ncbi:cytochrome P450 monooxygenase-like protein 9 [Elsinoe australis]|uniref:Cytochrome P450 monooxygenase-like protein 9 n=1 Tax=Elsinoe australis TaxID=40998 RepID=A0A4U7B9A7_9PEZI|nr:cytochrome P450 monooxygenase-like protein 9 [Elsinoe australis]